MTAAEARQKTNTALGVAEAMAQSIAKQQYEHDLPVLMGFISSAAERGLSSAKIYIGLDNTLATDYTYSYLVDEMTALGYVPQNIMEQDQKVFLVVNW